MGWTGIERSWRRLVDLLYGCMWTFFFKVSVLFWGSQVSVLFWGSQVLNTT
jgi:hypothetical protein